MLEVNPGSETKLSGFTAVSDFRGGGKRKGENGKRKTHRSSARRSSLQTPPPFGHPLRAPTLDWGV